MIDFVPDEKYKKWFGSLDSNQRTRVLICIDKIKSGCYNPATVKWNLYIAIATKNIAIYYFRKFYKAILLGGVTDFVDRDINDIPEQVKNLWEQYKGGSDA